MNPIKYIWLIAKLIHKFVMYQHRIKKYQKAFKTYPVDTTINPDIEEPIEIIGTGTTVENGVIWFNQN